MIMDSIYCTDRFTEVDDILADQNFFEGIQKTEPDKIVTFFTGFVKVYAICYA